MAQMYTTEGLDQILGIVPKGGTAFATLYCGLFTSQTASTVPAATAVVNGYTGFTELTLATNGYARIALTAGTWGALGAGTAGRKTTYPEITFTCATSAWAAVNGFFICTTSTAGTGYGLFFANFADTTAVTCQVGDSIKLTPTFGLKDGT